MYLLCWVFYQNNHNTKKCIASQKYLGKSFKQIYRLFILFIIYFFVCVWIFFVYFFVRLKYFIQFFLCICSYNSHAKPSYLSSIVHTEPLLMRIQQFEKKTKQISKEEKDTNLMRLIKSNNSHDKCCDTRHIIHLILVLTWVVSCFFAFSYRWKMKKNTITKKKSRNEIFGT